MFKTMNIQTLLLLVATMAVGIAAGIFFTWSNAVTPGLGKLSDREYILAFQSMNREIQNPLFFSVFFGAAVLLPVCSYVFAKQTTSMDWYLLLGATIVYLLGVMALTIFGNVPLNEALNVFDVAHASPARMEAQRNAFEAKWNLYNLLRSLASVTSLVLMVCFCMFRTK